VFFVLTYRDAKRRMFMGGVAGGLYPPAGWAAENKNWRSQFLVGAREGKALPLNEFDFDFKIF